MTPHPLHLIALAAAGCGGDLRSCRLFGAEPFADVDVDGEQRLVGVVPGTGQPTLLWTSTHDDGTTTVNLQVQDGDWRTFPAVTVTRLQGDPVAVLAGDRDPPGIPIVFFAASAEAGGPAIPQVVEGRTDGTFTAPVKAGRPDQVTSTALAATGDDGRTALAFFGRIDERTWVRPWRVAWELEGWSSQEVRLDDEEPFLGDVVAVGSAGGEPWLLLRRIDEGGPRGLHVFEPDFADTWQAAGSVDDDVAVHAAAARTIPGLDSLAVIWVQVAGTPPVASVRAAGLAGPFGVPVAPVTLLRDVAPAGPDDLEVGLSVSADGTGLASVFDRAGQRAWVGEVDLHGFHTLVPVLEGEPIRRFLPFVGDCEGPLALVELGPADGPTSLADVHVEVLDL